MEERATSSCQGKEWQTLPRQPPEGRRMHSGGWQDGQKREMSFWRLSSRQYPPLWLSTPQLCGYSSEPWQLEAGELVQIKEPIPTSGSRKTISANLYMRHLLSSHHCLCLSEALDRASIVNTNVPIKNVRMHAQPRQSPRSAVGQRSTGNNWNLMDPLGDHLSLHIVPCHHHWPKMGPSDGDWAVQSTDRVSAIWNRHSNCPLQYIKTIQDSNSISLAIEFNYLWARYNQILLLYLLNISC